MTIGVDIDLLPLPWSNTLVRDSSAVLWVEIQVDMDSAHIVSSEMIATIAYLPLSCMKLDNGVFHKSGFMLCVLAIIPEQSSSGTLRSGLGSRVARFRAEGTWKVILVVLSNRG